MSNSLTSSPSEITQAVPSASAPLRAFVRTDSTWTPTVARIALGAVMLPHGLQKTIGAFGGYGFEGTMGFLTGAVGLPSPVAFLVVLAESAGALALLIGLGSRLAAFGVAAVMLGAALTTHVQHGFFMNWSGAATGEGFEYHLLAIALAVIVMIAGGGRGSVDAQVGARLARDR